MGSFTCFKLKIFNQKVSLIATSKIRKKKKRKEKKEREVKVVAGRIEELEKEDKGRNYHFKVMVERWIRLMLE